MGNKKNFIRPKYIGLLNVLWHLEQASKMNKLQVEFGKCVDNFDNARNQLKKCIKNAMDRGLTQKEIMAVVDSYFGESCELCTAIVYAEIMKYEFKEKIHPDYET